MNAARWGRIEALFDQAIELPESRRGDFVASACAGDPELYRDLGGLLASSPETSASLRGAVIAEAQLLAGGAVAAQIGRRIGRFRIVSLLGEGGMGAVYLAEREGDRARVAIKILARAVGSPEAVARFRDERQILAALEHPNIVRLLDGGNTEDGLPYLVMEYIEGKTITQYARDRELSVRARLALVRRVCAALHYAHQNLVVHRDIKPDNILVAADGMPKILDFGIAKLLAPVASFAREARTRTGLALFTPEYASPEQARGDAVSTASDVYSVGAVLYELMTGQPPHRASGNSLEVLQRINEVDPPRPSTVGPVELRRVLSGDLDNIILKALRKEPARRYASMAQLSDDLGRYLDGQPVAARTAPVGPRARKFVRFHRRSVVAAIVVIATLLGATAVSLERMRRLADQAARAERDRASAVDAAKRAWTEVERARTAEDRVKAQLEQLEHAGCTEPRALSSVGVARELDHTGMHGGASPAVWRLVARLAMSALPRSCCLTWRSRSASIAVWGRLPGN